jgi:DEAD/DEAH box helicase domain-containing protein
LLAIILGILAPPSRLSLEPGKLSSSSAEITPSPLAIDGRLRDRVADAVIAQTGSRNATLNAYLRERLSGRDIERGALFSEPVFEGAASYQSSGQTPQSLANDLLHPDLAAALSAGAPGGDYRFDYPAYAHQLAAWKLLTAEQRNSVLVSSGTGSGKTECFLVPLLNDLAIESERAGRLSGVRALMLYPLNALIASQEERLRQWTRPFQGRIRFGLYNGLMLDKRKSTRDLDEASTPEQVLYRSTLRTDPPPILVTNSTMLEYMTIRRQDRPLVERSRGMLRWIIIDEAHSYVGSAAAEISLLLRRVLQTFEVKSSDVRFVATSATIGGSDEGARRDLQRYLADLAGVDLERVHVVFGERELVTLPQPGPSEAIADTHAAGRSLQQNPAVQALIRQAEAGPISLSQAAVHAKAAGTTTEALLEGVAAKALDGGRPLLPMRVHKFIRAVSGLWSCLDTGCSGGKPTDWPFGAVLFERADACPYCAAAVFEILNCSECGEAWLNAFDHGDRLSPLVTAPDGDEYAAAGAMSVGAFEADDEDLKQAEPETAPRIGRRRLLGVRPFARCKELTIDPKSGVLLERRSDGSAVLASDELLDDACPSCGVGPTAETQSPLRPFRYGAPFLLQNATPTLLEGVSTHLSDERLVPGEGRQLLSFTDSRQGTARFAANIETQSERGYVRAFIYHMAQRALPSGGDPEQREALERQIAKFEPLAADPDYSEMLDQKRAQLAALDQPRPIAWKAIVQALADDPTVKHWIRQVWHDRDERYRNSPEEFAEFLLLRELARRPRRANAVETMGLARLTFASIESLGDAAVPSEFRSKGLEAQDWRDFLYFLVDVSIRNLFVIRMDRRDARWLLPRKAFLRNIVGPHDPLGSPSDKAWPKARAGSVKSNAVKLLERVLKLDASEPQDRATLNDILERAWHGVRTLLDNNATTFALDFARASLEPVRDAWLCPVTNRVLPRLALGLSPYALRGSLPGADRRPDPIKLPTLPITFPRTAADRNLIANYLRADAVTTELRDRGVWSDLHTRAATFAPYIRAEEHSAQQPPSRLRGFEEEFKRHEINLLACSTTMEMGVDIGSVEAVLNTNVPPSIANYRQRVGRAGRRGQSFSTSLTLARNTPLDREAFRRPVEYLKRELRAPLVKLDSNRIVQRHVNALLLARWFAEANGQLTKTKSGDFFGCPGDLSSPASAEAPVILFARWLADPTTELQTRTPIGGLVSGTILERRGDLLEVARIAFAEAHDAYSKTWAALRDQARDVSPEAVSSLEKRVRRMCGEPLLKELANRSLLPGHGFPNSVVPFINDCAETRDRDQGSHNADDDRRNDRRYDYPSRNADVAIREYAPGAEVVIDGLVWTSAGVTLNWQRPATDLDAREVQSLRSFWRCESCKTAGAGHSAPSSCIQCGEGGLLVRRFLEPAGFRVAWSDKPHAHTDAARYIEPETPAVSAGDAAWVPLMDAALGRYRASQDGHVFHLSNGPSKTGYRVCLECGRAAPESSGALADHDSLTPRKGAAGRCPGNDRTFAITEPIALGHEVLTDVAELQPSGLSDLGAAWALASAMRESLCRGLGIETRELGLSVEARTGIIGDRTHSIFLFDQSTGGAGYAPQLFADIPTLLASVAQRLDCPAKCESGCSSCVLAADLFAQQEIVDRKAALAFVDNLRGELAAPRDEDVVGPDAKLSAAAADAITRRLNTDQVLTLFVSEDLDVSALYKPPLSSLFERAHRLGAVVKLALPAPAFTAMDHAARRGLRNASHRFCFVPVTASPPPAANGAVLIAHVEHANGGIGYFSRDLNSRIAGEGWGVGIAHPIVTVRVTPPSLDTIAEEDLERAAVAGDRVRELKGALSRPAHQFGVGLVKNILGPELEAAGLWKPGHLRSIDYTDRYLVSPLPVLLLARTLAALRDQLAPSGLSTDITVTTAPLKSDDFRSGAPTQVSHNWREEADREETILLLLGSLGLSARYDGRGAAHNRRLTLGYDDGSKAVIFFDQGFGYWRAPAGSRHDFNRSPASQAKGLADFQGFISGQGDSFIAITRQ